MKVRLNKYLSECGVASRRKADELIAEGKVRVNKSTVRTPGMSINLGEDVVVVDNKQLTVETKRYIILNKPKLYLTTLVNNEDDKPITADLTKNVNERVYPVGRLDYDSEGLVFLTNDGELANRIHHPKYGIKKTYNVTVKGSIEDKMMKRIKNGAKLGGNPIKPDSLKIMTFRNRKSKIIITFHEGKKHLVKNYLRYFGLRTEKLERTRIGNLQLGKLPRGNWRDLTGSELKMLRKKTGLA